MNYEQKKILEDIISKNPICELRSMERRYRMNITGYDVVIREITEREKNAGHKIVETWNVSEEITLAIINKYFPLPPNKTISICARYEEESDE